MPGVASVFFSDRLLIAAPVPAAKVTPDLKSLAWVPSRMSCEIPAVVLFCVNVAGPVTVNTPASVNAPLLLTSSVPLTVLVPSWVAALFTRITLPPARFTAPLKLLPVLPSVMAPAPALNVAAPATMLLPAADNCVMPVAFTVNAPRAGAVPEVSMEPVNAPLPILTAPPAWLASPVRISTAPPNVVMAALATLPMVTTQVEHVAWLL